MKSELRILANLFQKIAIYITGSNDPKLKEHIRMLDWVVKDGLCRDIEEIINDESYKLTPEKYMLQFELKEK